MRTLDGPVAIEQLQVGDLVLASSPSDDRGDVILRRITNVTENRGQLLDVTVNGEVIQATETPPFYVKSRGWTAAGKLNSGDLLRSHDRKWWPVESITRGRESNVYNVTVEKDGTYFVGGRDWGFSVWVSAACDRSPVPPRHIVNPNVVRDAVLLPNGREPNRLPAVFVDTLRLQTGIPGVRLSDSAFGGSSHELLPR